MITLFTALVLLFLQYTFATHTNRHDVYKLKETHTVPIQWKLISPAPPNSTLNLQIILENENRLELQRHFYEVSDPQHIRYGQHLGLSEVHKLLAPSPEAITLVHNWLLGNGISDFKSSPAKNRVTFQLEVFEAEQLLDTKYHIFEHADGSRLIRTTQWSLPPRLHNIINVIQPTTSFSRFTQPIRTTVAQAGKRSISSRQIDNNAIPNSCFQNVTLQCIKDVYKIDLTASTRNTKIGIANFLQQTAIEADVKRYLAENRGANPSSNTWSKFTDAVSISNGPLPDPSKDYPIHCEANLDAELILGLTYPMPLKIWSTGGGLNSSEYEADQEYPQGLVPDNEPWLTWLDTIRDDPNIPSVISLSYTDAENTVPKSVANEICTDFMVLGSRGVTVVAASGDDGLGTTGYCNNTAAGLGIQQMPMFIPRFPASCPYVTAVGATMFVDEAGQGEVAANFNADPKGPNSGFGFSNYFGRPTEIYKTDAVDAYVRSIPINSPKYKNMWNSVGRAYPDISAVGSKIAYTNGGIDVLAYGTSASAPIVASMLALINDALKSKGKSPLGFFNTWLYADGPAAAAAFNDITWKLPSNTFQGCNVDDAFFPVQAGWDIVTGWGSPNFTQLKIALGAV